MQTRCPHCETRFRVTETQVKAADGNVRCGVCKEVFNAYQVATDLARNEDQHSLFEEAGTPPSEEEKHFVQADETPSPTEQSDSFSDTPEQQQAEDETIDFNNTSATDESRKDTFDFFNEDDNESLSHVVPEKFKDSYASSPSSLISTLLWSIGILLLTTTLILEYIWFNKDQFKQVPEIQTAIRSLCQYIECQDNSLRAPEKIELITRNVYTHPNEKGALMVNVTMKNNADFDQPYPVLQINFSDIRGNAVAARRFTPGEYLQLPDDPNKIQQISTQSSASVTLEIQDPGKQAVTYEFEFL